ncbi:hypothetical protein [Planctomicrobium sp. SH527]|uniref:hypothetical protein n=1 Tax=Planctomicrobium sp. SH527 TaxID=3448123 RepID=UPI003F5BAFDF
MNVIPTAFLFRYTIPVLRQDKLPRAKAPLLKLPEVCQIPWPSALNGEPEFAKLALAWNPEGLAIEAIVTLPERTKNKKSKEFTDEGSLLIWIDTRDTQSQHRASRFCHQFVASTQGGGDDEDEPQVRQLPVPRAREDAPEVDPEGLLTEAEQLDDGYRLAVWLPREALHGFDPATQKRLGFMVAIHDKAMGMQTLTVNTEFPIDSDPSLWVSLELVEE